MGKSLNEKVPNQKFDTEKEKPNEILNKNK
jgi:hypothetical protein